MKRCFIFSAGSFFGLVTAPKRDDLCIAADAGLLLCNSLGIEPDIVVGDFDSMEKPTVCSELITAPVDKDDTDTLLALRLGLERGCTEFHLYGCTGGERADHSLANIQALSFLCRRGARGFMYGERFTYTVISSCTLELERTREGGTVSLFALSDRVEDVSLEGLRYPLSHAELSADFPLGVSNHFAADRARISCGAGLLLVCRER